MEWVTHARRHFGIVTKLFPDGGAILRRLDMIAS
jgi:hypothetical protein